ncbi:site-specific integrase [Paraburkholderia domus]|uniref:Tyrosine recombinase XerC n=1 Tax=Paraburkholderia domus TaxID=2793075 RepID=A0A9N8R4Y6_9BURK|nr:site-specific integrase [Paraburkholderia domus]MBK5169438.1 tyrosine-type recombinase/integrase [Burkholderia sp. R-70211]CAE6959792.1 Tyrosine recombinase XerC [Paraburkholderia domus]
MANQKQSLTLPPPRTYTRTDFTALRAFVQRVPAATIARLYYDSELAPQAASAEAMERYLRTMRDELVQLALLHGSPVLADHLKASIRQHGSAKLTAVTLRMVGQASTLAAAVPALAHPVHLWFRPLIARRLAGEGIATLGALVDYCNARGGSWWRSVPRIGALRARTLVAWLRRHEKTLGARVDADVDAGTGSWALVPPDGKGGTDDLVVIGGNPLAPRLAPFERLAVPAALSGGEGGDGTHGTVHRGTNRAGAFAYIRAPHDLAAIHAYLHRYRDRPATLRAYTRELERLILWAVVVRGVAVSSMTVEDCEAYKDFLATPSPAFTGPKQSRRSGRWRPFAPGGLAPDSQAYAVRVLRAAFTWLTDVRYLAGNPWAAVTDPVTVTREVAVQVGRALPAELWTGVRAALDARCARHGNAAEGQEAEARQWRTARAAILLMGDSGLRRDEAAHARRENLRLSPLPSGGAPVWALTVTGKRRKQRTVPVSAATVRALREHWADRGRDFDAPLDSAPLIVPLVIPATGTALKKHGGVVEAPYTADAFGHLVRQAIQRVTVEFGARPDVPKEHLVQLANTSAHAFRHTFGTRAVAREMPVDVVQAILGHASLQTTSIYVRAEQQRMLEAAAQYYAADDE